MPQTGPPRTLKKIAFLEGCWEVVMDVKPDPNADWIENKAVSNFQWILDGAAMEQTFEGSMMGRPFNGRGYLAFNRYSGKWQHSWSDNVAALLSFYEGDFDDDKLVVIGREATPETSFQVRITWFNITENEFDWLLETSLDGQKWLATMRAVYKRKEA
jgi:hypothetical protein